MLNKLDLKLFEILDEEVDKEVTNWCFLKIQRSNSLGEPLSKIPDIVKVFYLDIYNTIFCKNKINWELNERTNTCWQIRSNFITKIIWHYPTHADVLRHIVKKWNGRYWYEDDELIFFIYIIDKWGQWKDKRFFKLDITKPIEQYTDKQKEELIEFLELIK